MEKRSRLAAGQHMSATRPGRMTRASRRRFVPIISTHHDSLMTMIKKVDRYEIKSELGKPGLSEVYLAYDPTAKRQVVIKILRKQDQANAEFRERLKREAQVLGKLENAPIVPMYEFKERRTRSYIVMRYMPGGTLSDLIKNKSMSLEDIIPIVNRVAEALDAAHANGVVHRDLKPNNILFDENGVAFLSDFGLAKQLDASEPITQTTAQIGTPRYMSPEHVSDPRHIDGRSDVFPLGVILYEMLTGKHPYEDTSSVHKVFDTILHGEVPQLKTAELAELNLPLKCNRILAKSLAKDRAARYATAGDMANDVARLRDSATSAEFKQSPADASTVRRLALWLARQGDDRVYGGVADKKQFGRMFMWSRILIAAISFILLTLAGGLLWSECSRLTTSPSPTPTATATIAVMIETPSATATISPTISPSFRPTPTSSVTLIPTKTDTATPTRTFTATPMLTSMPIPTKPTVAFTLTPEPTRIEKQPTDTAAPQPSWTRPPIP